MSLGGNKFHSKLTTVDGIHTLIAIEFADSTERLAYTPAAEDLGKIVRQVDTNSYWVINNVAPLGYTELTTILPISVKGDILTHNGSGNAALAVGTDGQVLISDSAEVDGLKWKTLGLGDITQEFITATPELETLEDHIAYFHSAGAGAGGVISDDGDGTITVSSGFGFMRETNDTFATLKAVSWSAESGVNVDLTDNALNWIYVEYNGGSPRVVATVMERTDYETNILLGKVFRLGTDLNLDVTTRLDGNNHATQMQRRNWALAPFARESGGVLTDLGSLKVLVSTGVFWDGFEQFSTPEVDTSGVGTFSYWYDDGLGGWTQVPSNTDIDNNNYDDGSGTLAALTASHYGVHWVYLERDGDLHIVYGSDSYSIIDDAQNAMIPSNIPPLIASVGRLIGKIIVQKGASTLTTVESVFTTIFIGSAGATDHNDLLNKGVNTHAQIDSHIASANIHIDWTAPGAGTIDPSNYADNNTDELVKCSSNDTTAGYLEDKIVAANGTNTTSPLEKSTLNDGADEDVQLRFDQTKVDHDALINFVANEHIDHSAVTVTGTDGLTGGGDITASRTISMPDVVTAGSSSAADSTLGVTVDAKGRITAFSRTAIAILASQVTDFAAAVRAVTLTGLSTATNAAITASDTVLSAFGKLQAQLNKLPEGEAAQYSNSTSQSVAAGLNTDLLFQTNRESVLGTLFAKPTDQEIRTDFNGRIGVYFKISFHCANNSRMGTFSVKKNGSTVNYSSVTQIANDNINEAGHATFYGEFNCLSGDLWRINMAANGTTVTVPVNYGFFGIKAIRID